MRMTVQRTILHSLPFQNAILVVLFNSDQYPLPRSPRNKSETPEMEEKKRRNLTLKKPIEQELFQSSVDPRKVRRSYWCWVQRPFVLVLGADRAETFVELSQEVHHPPLLDAKEKLQTNCRVALPPKKMSPSSRVILQD